MNNRERINLKKLREKSRWKYPKKSPCIEKKNPYIKKIISDVKIITSQTRKETFTKLFLNIKFNKANPKKRRGNKILRRVKKRQFIEWIVEWKGKID